MAVKDILHAIFRPLTFDFYNIKFYSIFCCFILFLFCSIHMRITTLLYLSLLLLLLLLLLLCLLNPVNP